MLLEGQDFDPDKKKDSLDGIWQIITIILHKRLAEEGTAYEPKIWDTVAAARLEKAFNEFLSSTEHLHRPKNFGNLEFSYWDTIRGKYNYASLVSRNNSMVKAITHAIQQAPDTPVVVMAGSTHLPLGEYYNISQLIPQLNEGILPDFANYYAAADAMRIERSKGKALRYYEEWLGSSKVIHEFLLPLQAHIIQAIPHKTLAFWRRLAL